MALKESKFISKCIFFYVLDTEVIHEEQPLDVMKAQGHQVCEQPIPHEVPVPHCQHYAPYTQHLPQPQPYQYQGYPAQEDYQPMPYGYGPPPPPPAQYYPPVYPSHAAMYMPLPTLEAPMPAPAPVAAPESASVQIALHEVDAAPGAASVKVPPSEVHMSVAPFSYWHQAAPQGQNPLQISVDYPQGVPQMQPVQPYSCTAPVPVPTLEAVAPIVPPQPCFPASATVAQVSVKPPRRKGKPQRDVFEAAKMMAKSLVHHGTHPSADQSPSPPRKAVDVPTPVPFPVLDYSQTTVLAFAYELDSHMDEDVSNCYQLAMHVGVHPSVIQVTFWPL